MSKTTTLSITPREQSGKGAIRQLRREGLLPGAISRKGEDTVSFSVSKSELKKALEQGGTSAVYMLQTGKKENYPAMVREIQSEPVTREWLHVTFQAVSMTEETTAEIPLVLLGRDDIIHAGYTLQQQLETLPVRGLPGDFPAGIEIDVSAMIPGDHVLVADLKLPEGIVPHMDEDRQILSVIHPRIRAEEEAADEEASDGGTSADGAESRE